MPEKLSDLSKVNSVDLTVLEPKYCIPYVFSAISYCFSIKCTLKTSIPPSQKLLIFYTYM